jgi:predicted RNase H-like HicB family nuclease
MRKVNAIIERASDGNYSIYSDAEDLDYLITGTGSTVEEAKQCFEGGYADMRRVYAEDGKPFTEVEMVYKYDMASFLAYYSKVISLAGLSRLTGINQQQLSHYVTGRRNPSPKTVAKVEKAIHLFAQDLASVHFA